ncbi:MAG: acyl-CoA thioesterase II [Pseudomonadota bacterium]
MSKGLASLIDNIELEQIEINLFRGEVLDYARNTVYGGQVLAQAVYAARATVSSRFELHSIHAYFLRPGDSEMPVVYEVDRIRDGKHFTTRRVVAIQHGRAIFNVSLSFHQPEKNDDAYRRQDKMPEVPEPETLLSDENYYSQLYKGSKFELAAWPIEYRQVDPAQLDAKASSKHYVWLKADGHIAQERAQHQELLAYASYNHMMSTAMRPFGVVPWDPKLQAVTLDHAIWFHRPFRIDDWLLCELNSPSAAGHRVFTQGNIFNRRGQLIATVAQEGLVRKAKS